MALTGQGYVELGQQAEAAGKRADRVAKDNPYHDTRGRFTTAEGAGQAEDHSTNARTHVAEAERAVAPTHSFSSLENNQIQEALVSCEELWDSDWAICHSALFADDPNYYKQCMIGLLQRNKECLGGLPLSPCCPIESVS